MHTGVAEVVEALHAMNPQHNCLRVGSAAPSELGIEGPDGRLQTLPGNPLVHPLEE